MKLAPQRERVSLSPLENYDLAKVGSKKMNFLMDMSVNGMGQNVLKYSACPEQYFLLKPFFCNVFL